MPKFEQLWSDMRYATKRDYQGGDILKGNHGACWICKEDTQFWDETLNLNVCSTECDDELWLREAREDLAHEYNRLYKKADSENAQEFRVNYDMETNTFTLCGNEIKEESVRAMIAALKRGESTRPKFACNPNPYAGTDL